MINFKRFFTRTNADLVSATHLRRELRAQLNNRMNKEVVIILADQYYTPISIERVAQIYNNSDIKNFKYEPDRFDCDDYSVVLKSKVVKAVKKDRKAIYAYAFGIVFGNIPTPHAINWFMTPERKILFIEPQSGEIFDPIGKNIVFLFS